MNNNVLDSSLPLLIWFADETFYSLCSRQHYWLGNPDTLTTLKLLYGDTPRTISHDFPGNLNSLRRTVTRCWGDATEIIYQHTILPLFCPFQPEARIADIETAMRSPSIGSLKYSMGLLTGRFGAHHPLKACLMCIAEDRKTHGVAYWHRSHQYPGVILCPVHQTLLLESHFNRPWSGRFRWALPEEEHLYSVAPASSEISSLKTISCAVLGLAALATTKHFNPTIVHEVYLEAFKCAAERREQAVSQFLIYAMQLQPYPPFTSLPTTLTQAASFIAQMTRTPRGNCHPLKHLTFITWLFGSLSEFISAYDCFAEHSTSVLRPEPGLSSSLVKTPKLTLPCCQPVVRKPKKLKPMIRAEIIQTLKAGVDKQLLCNQFHITICTINRVIRAEEGLKDHLLKLRQDEKMNAYRTLWLEVVRLRPGAGPSEIRVADPKTFAWLYRHDRSWLKASVEHLPSGRKGNNSNTDWEQRDEDLSELVKITLNQIRNCLNDRKAVRTEIYKKIPSLYRALEKRNRYPKTRAILLAISFADGTL